MAPKRCPHEAPIMVAYVAAAPKNVHSTASWCPACGALGWMSYGDAVVHWQLPRREVRRLTRPRK
jgi:hypothetical protein